MIAAACGPEQFAVSVNLPVPYEPTVNDLVAVLATLVLPSFKHPVNDWPPSKSTESPPAKDEAFTLSTVFHAVAADLPSCESSPLGET